MQDAASVWFVARAGESEGPYAWSELRSAVRRGLLRPKDWVWRQGMSEWVRVEEQEGLLDGVPPPPPMSAQELAEASEVAMAEGGPQDGPIQFGATVPKRPSADLEVPPTPDHGGFLGETTKYFLAAAGVSENARQRRHRRAAAAVVVGGLLAGGGLFAFSALKSDPDVDAHRVAAAPSARSAGQHRKLKRAEACKLTGDCRRSRPRRRAAAQGDYHPDKKTALKASRAQTPESIDIGELKTRGGAKSGPVAKKKAAKIEQRRESRKAGLTSAQTALVKRKVTPALKHCKGVFAPRTVKVRVETDKRGRVSKASVPRGPSAVKRCLEKRARYWRFGKNLRSRVLELTVPAKAGVVRVSSEDG